MSTRKDSSTTICIPGPEGWELWGSAAGGPFVREQGGGEATPADFRSATLYAVPAVEAFCVPLWIAAEDPALVDAALELQLEVSGLKSTVAEGEHIDRRSVAQEEKRTLFRVIVLPDAFDPPLPRQLPTRYDVSPNCYVLPENQIVLWCELGRLVFAVTRADQVVYFQGLSARRVGSAAASEIRMAVMSLHAQGVFDELEGATVWTDGGSIQVEPAEFAAFESDLGIPVIRARRPAPIRPASKSLLLPASVAAARRAAHRRRQIRTAVLAVAAAYLILAAVLGGRYFLKEREVAALRDDVAALKRDVGWIPGEKARFFAVESSLDVDAYPFETLRRIYEHLPEKGVRFTEFRVNKSGVFVSGEARDQNEAIRFQNAVRRDPSLSRFTWDAQRPNINPRDKTANFQLTGDLSDGATEG